MKKYKQAIKKKMTSLSHQDLKKQRLMVVYAKEKKKEVCQVLIFMRMNRKICPQNNQFYRILQETSGNKCIFGTKQFFQIWVCGWVATDGHKK